MFVKHGHREIGTMTDRGATVFGHEMKHLRSIDVLAACAYRVDGECSLARFPEENGGLSNEALEQLDVRGGVELQIGRTRVVSASSPHPGCGPRHS